MLKPFRNSIFNGNAPRYISALSSKSTRISHVLYLRLSLERLCMKTTSHYNTLGLSQNATESEIKDAYISLCKICHPDNNLDDPSLHSKFLKIKEAYSVLSHPTSRKTYDSTLMLNRKRQLQRNHQYYHDSFYNSSNFQEDFSYSTKNKFDQNFWENSERGKDDQKDLTSTSNFTDVIGIFCFCFIVLIIIRLSSQDTDADTEKRYTMDLGSYEETYNKPTNSYIYSERDEHLPQYPVGKTVKLNGEEIEIKYIAR